MAFSALLLAAAAAAAAASVGKAATFAQLVAGVDAVGEVGVISGALAGYLGVDDPTPCKTSNFPPVEDEALRSVYSCPRFVLLVTRRASRDTEERRFLRLSSAGKLEQVVVWRDQHDEQGNLKVNGRSVVSINVGGKQAKAWFHEEERYYFRHQDRRRSL